MNFCQRALRYISRQKGKSALLGGIFFISLAISTFGISALRVTNHLIEDIGAHADVSVHVFSGDFVSNELSEGLLNQMLVLGNVRSVNRSNRLSAEEYNEDRTFNLYGFDDLTLDGPFLWQGVQLASGTYELNERDVLVHRDLAEALEWGIGDTITLETSQNEPLDVTIAGFYQEVDQSLEFDLSVMYVTPDLIDLLQGESLYVGLQAMIENPRELDVTYDHINDMISGHGLNVTVLDTLYQQLKTPMEGLQQLLEVILVVTLLVTVVVVSLLLVLWVKERQRETGILLAIGETKKDILMQRVLELFLLFGIVFSAIALITVMALPRLGSHLFANFNALEGTSDLGTATLSLGASDLVIAFGIGTVIILISVFMASLPLFRMQPKEMLTRID